MRVSIDNNGYMIVHLVIDPSVTFGFSSIHVILS
jgi:hypothetical protein